MTRKLPAAAPALEAARLVGAWYVLVSNHDFWRARTHPRVEHELMAADRAGRTRLRSSLRFRQPDLLGRTQRRAIHGTDTVDDAGQCRWRGEGLLSLVECQWSVPLVDPDYRWAVVWYAATRLGIGPGLAIHTRDPSIPQDLLDAILAELRDHPFLQAGSRSAKLRATVQDWIPPQPYRL